MFQRLIERRLAASKKSVLLLGARQVGKSTLARKLAPDLTIDLSEEGTYLAYAKDPARLAREVRALARRSCILIDEVQRVPTLLNTVQALIDEGQGHRFLLTGSSARKLKRGGANLLPGRVILEHLDPLSVWELGEAFDLDRVLTIGSLPGIYSDKTEGVATLESYATAYLREEVQAEAIVRDLGSFARFVDMAAANSGFWVNYSKLSSDSEIPKETLRRYYQILEDTLLAFTVPPFASRRVVRRASQRDRVFLFDLGVRNALLGAAGHRPVANEKGRLFEQWIVLQCLYFIRAHRLPWRVYSYRTDAGAEVDAVVDTGHAQVAIECKLGHNVTAADLRGLGSFAAVATKPAKLYVVFGGDRQQKLNAQVTAVPFRAFLQETLPRLAGVSSSP